MRRLPHLLLILAGLSARAQEAGGFEGSLTNDLLIQQNELAKQEPGPNHPQPGPRDGWRQYQEALTLSASYRFEGGTTVSLGATGRGVNFYQQASDLTLDQADRSLYRKYLTFQSGGFTARAGDFYALLGRGLVLSVLPIDKLLKERTLDGGELRYQGNRFELRALAGTVRTETRDQAWRVQGGEAKAVFLEGPSAGIHRLGAHAAQLEDVPTDQIDPFLLPLLRKRTLHAFSLGGDQVGRVLDYYVEEARLNWEHKPDDFMEIPGGKATYANLTLHPKHVFLMAEYRRYAHFETDLIHPENTLNNPPLADREDEKNNLTNSEVTRLLVQVSGGDPSISFFASGSRIKENAGGPFDPQRDQGHNVYGGFSLEDLGGWLSASATYGVRNIIYPERRTDAALAFRFTPRWSLELKARDKRHVDTFENHVRESDYEAQISCSPRFSIYARKQFRSDPGKNFTDNWFPSGGVRMNLWKGSFIDVSGGSIRGGLVCSGGQCREMPDFKGWKVATHFVFR